MLTFRVAVAMRRKAIDVICLDRSAGGEGLLKREKNFLRPELGSVGICWVAAR